MISKRWDTVLSPAAIRDGHVIMCITNPLRQSTVCPTKLTIELSSPPMKYLCEKKKEIDGKQIMRYLERVLPIISIWRRVFFGFFQVCLGPSQSSFTGCTILDFSWLISLIPRKPSLQSLTQETVIQESLIGTAFALCFLWRSRKVTMMQYAGSQLRLWVMLLCRSEKMICHTHDEVGRRDGIVVAGVQNLCLPCI